MRVSLRLVAVAAALLLASGCSGSTDESLRVGIVTDCYGIFSSFAEPTVASASLPLIERGAKVLGPRPSDGISDVSVAGRNVELIAGCAEGTSPLLDEARRLVEENGVRVLLGPLTAENALALREYARRRPETTFVMVPSPSQQLTLADPLPNVFRFSPDGAQTTAGLGAHAFNELGWRNAVIVADDLPYGWEQAAGFVAEFCALGGRIAQRLWIPLGSDPAALTAQVPAGADGVFAAGTVSPLLGFLEGYSRTHPDLSKRLVAGETLLLDSEIMAQLGSKLRGTVVGGAVPLEPTEQIEAYVGSFAKAFPSLPPESALVPIVFPYRDGVEAVLTALEQIEGDLADDGAGLRRALASVAVESPVGRIRLDENRQAVTPMFLSRLEPDSDGRVAPRAYRVLRNIDQSFGGYFGPDSPAPSRSSPDCHRGDTPAWAR